MSMPQAEPYEDVVLGSGGGGKLLAWHLARSGRRVAVVERRWVGGSCPNRLLRTLGLRGVVQVVSPGHGRRRGRWPTRNARGQPRYHETHVADRSRLTSHRPSFLSR